MKTITTKIMRYKSDVLTTRRFGSCYIPVWNRDPVTDPQTGIEYSWAPYGRSFQGGGHKCKAYAHKDGKPVLTRDI